MRGLYVFFVCCFVFALCLSLGSFTVSATDLEDPTVPDTEIVLSDSTDPTESQESLNLVPIEYLDSGISVAAVTGSELDGLASWTLSDTQLGNITLYLAHDANSSGIKIVNNQLVNYNNSTVYFFCPDYSGYSFSASRFSPVYYRANYTGAQTTLLSSNNIEVDQIDFTDFSSYITIGILVVIMIFLLWRCIFK